MIEHLWLMPLGFAAGLLGSMTGLGGGIITVPVMIFFGFPHVLAASNSLFATLSNAVASTLSYTRQRRIEYRLGLKLGLMSVPGTVVGAMATTDVAPALFLFLFGMVLAISAAYLLMKGRLLKLHGRPHEHVPDRFSGLMLLFVMAASFFAGLTSSFFGIGGGIVFVPLMVVGLGMTMRRAAPTSQMILMFASTSGLLVHGMLGNPDLFQALLLAAGTFAGGLAGARMSMEIRERHLRLLAFGVIAATAVKFFYDSIAVVVGSET